MSDPQRLFDLTGQTAFISGGSSGIGAHAAATLAAAGCRIALGARRAEPLEAIATSLPEHAAASVHPLDVTDRTSVERGFAAAVAAHGHIDILINSAGIAAPAPFTDMSEADWQRVLDTNLTGLWRLAQVAARHMRERGSGSIVNLASLLGLRAQARNANYTASKAAVIQLTRNMAVELRSSGVRVNALAPGYFETDLNRAFLASERGRAYIKNLFPGRTGELEELSGALLLLAGPAGSYINGSVLVVDGGSQLGDV